MIQAQAAQRVPDEERARARGRRWGSENTNIDLHLLAAFNVPVGCVAILLLSLRNAPFPAVLSSSQQHLAAAMKTDWVNLARTGSESPLTWPRFGPASQQVRSLIPPLPQGRDQLLRAAPVRVLGPGG